MALPARRRGRARLDDDHRVRPRHPAGEHADRRARRRARPRPALPDPRPRRPLGRDRARLPLLPRRARADAGGARAARDARRPHRARRRLRDRDARPRDPRRRRPARRASSPATSPPLGFELYVELLERGRRRAVRASAASAARPVRVDARVDAYVPAALHRRRGAQDRPPPAARAAESEDELRELRAATEDRFGPLPEPVENLFAIQEAKLKLARARRRLPRLPRRAGDRRAARARLRRAARAPRRIDTAVYTSAQARGLAARRRLRRSSSTGRCYTGCAPGSLRTPLHLAHFP